MAGVAVMAALKAALVISGVLPFNADEAVVALMARHILQGERPVFFYGQAYLGSLDAVLVAIGYRLFGQHVWVIRLLQSLLYLGTLLTTAWLGRQVFHSWLPGVIAVWLLAIPTVNVTLYTTVSLGGYGEALLLGNLILLVGLRAGQNVQAGKTAGFLRLLAVWGFLAGFGVWAFGLTLVYSLPTGLYLLFSAWRSTESTSREQQSAPQFSGWQKTGRFVGFGAVLSVAGLLGAAPWWWFGLQNGFGSLLWELHGGAIASAAQAPWLLRSVQHAFYLLLFGGTVTFGLRPPWSVDWLALPVLPFVLVFWVLVLANTLKTLRCQGAAQHQQWVILGVCLTLLSGLVFSPFGMDPSGRYFVPLAVPLALFAAQWILRLRARGGRTAYALVLLVLGFNAWGTIQCALRSPPGLTTQFDAVTRVDHRYVIELAHFLHSHGETRGYTNYWVSYPLAFHSAEQLIYVPALPYHPDFRYTRRDDRYPLYTEQVAQAERVAFITTRHTALDEHLRQQFKRLDISWQEARIGDYQIFYALSGLLRPEQIGLGKTTP